MYLTSVTEEQMHPYIGADQMEDDSFSQEVQGNWKKFISISIYLIGKLHLHPMGLNPRPQLILKRITESSHIVSSQFCHHKV